MEREFSKEGREGVAEKKESQQGAERSEERGRSWVKAQPIPAEEELYLVRLIRFMDYYWSSYYTFLFFFYLIILHCL